MHMGGSIVSRNVWEKKGRIKWNFTKFLVDSEGNVVDRFEPTTKPEEIEESVEKLLK